jgi:hypothetical protein
MNLDPIRNAAADIASFFAAGIWPDPGVDDGSGWLMPALRVSPLVSPWR